MNVFARIVNPRIRIHSPWSLVKRNAGAYDAPAQTTTTIINHKDVKVNMINTYSQIGFRLMNNSFLLGPTVILPDKVFHWHIEGDEDIHAKSLQFFFHLHPQLDLLIIGLSDPSVKPKIEKDVFMSCRKHNIQVEILPTPKAVSTYNFLAEIRTVAGAFVPPAQYAFDENDIIEHKLRLGLMDGRDPYREDTFPVIFPAKRPKD